MKTDLVILLIEATLIPLGAMVQGVAAEKTHIQASFYPYYEFTRDVAESSSVVEQFLPLDTEAHGWEPNISKARSLQDADVFVYNGMGIETYLDRLTQSGDISHIAFVKASDSLVLISHAGIDEMIREALEEYTDGHHAAEEAVEAITDIPDAEEIRHGM